MIPILIDLRQHPLRRATREGKVYVRRKFVSNQIESLREIEESDLLKRIAVRQEEGDNSLKSETLVFLFRSLRNTLGVRSMAHLEDEIGVTLSERIARILGPLRRDFDGDPNRDERYEEFRLEVVTKFFEKICDSSTDVADYAEVSFGQFVIGLARNEKKKYFNERKQFAKHDDLSVLDTSRALYSRDILDHTLFSVLELPGLNQASLLKAALDTLPEPQRTAWVLRNAEEWPIDGSSNEGPTLALYFGVSGRTIRNWLSSAEEKLNNWRTPAE